MNLNDKILIEQLRSDINRIPNAIPTNDSLADLEWVKFRNTLRQNILTNDPKDFLRWEIILNTMFHGANIAELQFLQQPGRWEKWKPDLKESAVGNPYPYPHYPESSGNLIHHAFSLAQLLVNTDCSIEALPQVVEFGGGYGSMCRLLYRMGFKGRYIIYDLPEFSALQSYYLSSIGVPTSIKRKPTHHQDSIVLLSDLKDLSKQLQVKDRKSNYLFIGTWSISETSLNFRNAIFDLVSKASYYLIAYQNFFGEVNNLDFFSSFAEARKHFNWSHFEIDHLQGNKYLIGQKR